MYGNSNKRCMRLCVDYLCNSYVHVVYNTDCSIKTRFSGNVTWDKVKRFMFWICLWLSFNQRETTPGFPDICFLCTSWHFKHALCFNNSGETYNHRFISLLGRLTVQLHNSPWTWRENVAFNSVLPTFYLFFYYQS